MNAAIESLREHIEDEVADMFLLDNCVIGSQVSKGERIKDSQASLELIQEHDNVFTTAEILGELKAKIGILEKEVDAYCARRRYRESSVSYKGRRSHREREIKNVLGTIIEYEKEIARMLQERAYQYGNKKGNPFESVVEEAYRAFRNTESVPNTHDKNLVAAALLLAVDTGRRVAIVTADHRMEILLKRTQMGLDSVRPIGVDIRRELTDWGGVVILKKNEEGTFDVQYRSSDFNPEPRPRSDSLRILVPLIKRCDPDKSKVYIAQSI